MQRPWSALLMWHVKHLPWHDAAEAWMVRIYISINGAISHTLVSCDYSSYTWESICVRREWAQKEKASSHYMIFYCAFSYSCLKEQQLYRGGSVPPQKNGFLENWVIVFFVFLLAWRAVEELHSEDLVLFVTFFFFSPFLHNCASFEEV